MIAPVPHTLAIDLGGTAIKAAIVDADGRLVARGHSATPPPGRPDLCREVIERLLTALSTDPTEMAGVIGMCVAGTLDPCTGVMGYASNLGLVDTPIRSWLEEIAGVPISLHRDGVAFAAAECVHGAARGCSDALVVGLGTGVAVGTIVDGALRGTTRPRGGEMGHAPGGLDAEPCTCGGQGCAEAYIGAAAICRRYLRRTGQHRSAQEVIAASSAGDADAMTIVSDAVSALAHVLANYVATMDPSLIIVAGGLSKAGDVLLEPLRARLTALMPWRAAPAIVASSFGADGGLIGAAALATQHSRLEERS